MAALMGVSPKTWASRGWWTVSVALLGAVIGVLFAIFAFVIARGVPALKPEIFVTPTHGIAGGLSNAIAGTFMLVTVGLVLVTVVGLGTAIWTVEFAPAFGKRTIRFMVDVLAGVP